jgi:predicted histidine transporter YuiF (NhaC family)
MILVAMPRETQTDLFTSHVTQALFLGLCLIGLVLTILVIMQNYAQYRDRCDREYESQEVSEIAYRDAKRDFRNAFIMGAIVVVFLIILIINMGIRLFFVN